MPIIRPRGARSGSAGPGGRKPRGAPGRLVEAVGLAPALRVAPEAPRRDLTRRGGEPSAGAHHELLGRVRARSEALGEAAGPEALREVEHDPVAFRSQLALLAL